MRRVTFEPTDMDFANPERGFFTIYDPFFSDNSNAAFTAEDLMEWGERNASTLVSKRYAIDDYRTRDLSAAFLAEVEADFETTREAGFKMIPKFMYVWNLGIDERDAPLEWTLRHIEQLAPLFVEHSEVLDHVPGGFIGRWGEMHSSTEGHVVPGTVRLSESGEEIVSALLDAVPGERMVALRYPQQIEAIVGGPVGPEDAYGESIAARTGFFNDGFLYDETDFGTFDARASERAEQERFIERATEFTVTSGEPAGSDGTSYTFDADPAARLDAQNFASLSAEQTDAISDGVYEDWTDRGLYDDISRGLGYRFELFEARLPEDVFAGGTMEMRLTVENVGYARAHNERPLEVVLRGPDGTEHRLPTGVDARDWGEDGPVRVDLSLDLPADLAPGGHEVLLALPDPAPELADDPRYAIRLANEGIWEAETGQNVLGAQVTVRAAPPDDDPVPKVILHVGDISARTPAILENLGHIDALPYDGIVVNVPDSWLLMNGAWVSDEAETRRWLEPLSGAFENLTENYILTQTDDPGDLFDDAAWAQVVDNWRILARVAEEVGFAGIQFDNEEYFDPWDDFPEDYSPDGALRGLEAYQAQASLRGREVVQAVAEVWPDAKLSVMHGPYLSVDGGPAQPPAIEAQTGGSDQFELLGPFFTGLAEGAGPDMTIIDGGELYQLRDEAEFQAARAWRAETVPGLIDWEVDPVLLEDWDARIAFGSTIYTDEFPSGSPQNPESFETTLANAIATSEELVVVFSEIGQLDWLQSGALPPEWEQAVIDARGLGGCAPTEVIGAAGTATIRQAGPDAWTRVEFGATLEDAVVVLGPPTANGPQPTSMRVRDVDETGFEMQVDEWDYLDGRHARESVGWMALEAGTHRLADGRSVEAGWAEAGMGWSAVALAGPFDDAPAIFATISSPDDTDALTPRLRGVEADGFNFRTDGQERKGADPAGSRIGYVAMETGGGGGIEAGAAGRIDHLGADVALTTGFDDIPVLLATMQTTRGRDPAALRLDGLESDRATLRVEEERSRDDEIRHRLEDVAYLAVTAGLIEGQHLMA